MSWISPNISKQDLEMMLTSLDDYIYYLKEDSMDSSEIERLYYRLNRHWREQNG
jgi:hypothetical protein